MKCKIALYLLVLITLSGATIPKKMETGKGTDQKNTIKEVDSLLQLHEKFYKNNIDRAFEAVQKALHLADNEGYVLGRVSARNRLGTSFRYQGNIDKALTNFFEAQKILKIELAQDPSPEKLKVYELKLGKTNRHIGTVYAVMGHYPLALKYYNKAKSIFEKNNISEELVYINISKANVYASNSDFEYGKSEYLKSIPTIKQLEKKNTLGILYFNIALMNFELEEYSLATKYADSALNISIGSKDFRRLGKALTLKADISYEQKQFERSLSLLDSALIYLNKSKDKPAQSTNEIIRAEIYVSTGKHDLAEKILLATLVEAELSFFHEEAIEACKILVDIYSYNKDTPNILKFKSKLLDLKIQQEKVQDDDMILEEKYAEQFDEQADLFDFKERLYKKSNGVLLLLFSLLAGQLVLLVILFQKKKSIDLNYS
ncbi:hypothetical protein MTsPCn5_24780 [Croceitalea sp. MTPC5]|uniref:tetratricopeptide repeat protein n=1 Tax=Croceitalea sp. MTPC5 TaxID=3056565 RepID=UPI002B3B84D8|nr:hypothetical protein MTsPCn5_24780 [Croceitalea sp. MTPC5]